MLLSGRRGILPRQSQPRFHPMHSSHLERLYLTLAQHDHGMLLLAVIPHDRLPEIIPFESSRHLWRWLCCTRPPGYHYTPYEAFEWKARGDTRLREGRVDRAMNESLQREGHLKFAQGAFSVGEARGTGGAQPIELVRDMSMSEHLLVTCARRYQAVDLFTEAARQGQGLLSEDPTSPSLSRPQRDELRRLVDLWVGHLVWPQEAPPSAFDRQTFGRSRRAGERATDADCCPANSLQP